MPLKQSADLDPDPNPSLGLSPLAVGTDNCCEIERIGFLTA